MGYVRIKSPLWGQVGQVVADTYAQNMDDRLAEGSFERVDDAAAPALIEAQQAVSEAEAAPAADEVQQEAALPFYAEAVGEVDGALPPPEVVEQPEPPPLADPAFAPPEPEVAPEPEPASAEVASPAVDAPAAG